MKYALIGLLMLMITSVKAQTQSASHLKAAEALLEATNMAEQLTSSYNTLIDASSAQIPKEKQAKFKQVMLAFLNKHINYAALKPELTRIYAQEFTESDLKQITQFYLTPAGKRMNSKMPVLLQKSIALGQQKMQQHMPEFQAELKKAFPNN